MRVSSPVFAILASICLSGCIIGVDLPDPRPYVADCPAPIGAGANVLPNASTSGRSDARSDTMFFMATGLPDCRSGSLEFARLRYTQPTYGISEPLEAEAAEAAPKFIATSYSQEAWTDLLRERLFAGENDGRVLVFIHGYNNDFAEAQEAAWRTSRAYFNNVPVVVLRWPSQASATNYIFDEGSIGWSQAQIDRTILGLAQLDARITLVAHSMGSRAAINAAKYLDSARPDLASRLERIVLASPDVDRSMALRPEGEIEGILNPSRQILIYTSARDVPLGLSRDAHGYARLGSSNCRYDVDFAERRQGEDAYCHLAIAHDNLAIVDTTKVASQGRYRHSDFLDSCAANADLTAFLREEKTFPMRQRIERDGRAGYWINPELAAQHAGCAEAD